MYYVHVYVCVCSYIHWAMCVFVPVLLIMYDVKINYCEWITKVDSIRVQYQFSGTITICLHESA